MSPEEYCKLLADYVGINVEVRTTTPPSYISNLKLCNGQEPIILIHREVSY